MKRTPEQQLAIWRHHPARMVRDIWGVEPDPWQEDVLESFPICEKIAMQACKGPGKTTTLAWIAWNYLLTRPSPKIGATSITEDNLKNGLWSEMAKWYTHPKAEILRRSFEYTKSRIFERRFEDTWFMAALTWPKTADSQRQADTMAGLHADYTLFILDESGGIPDAVMATAEATLSSCVEGHIVQAGNPVMTSGPLYRASTTQRHLWKVFEITGDPDDPKRSPRVSVKWAKEQIEQYGRNHPFVLVNVFGKFPPSSINALISMEELIAATKRVWTPHDIKTAPKILGVDVARFGDDTSVIIPRQGLQCFIPEEKKNIESNEGAAWVGRIMDSFGADAVFIDDTGGFGSGWVDNLRRLGRDPIGIAFSQQAHDSTRFANKRAEMYWDAVQWIKDGGAIPDCQPLMQALASTTYTFQGDQKLILEPKDYIKSRLGFSPDHADALVLTFAEPVMVKAKRGRGRHVYDYDPFAERDSRGDYDPFASRDAWG